MDCLWFLHGVLPTRPTPTDRQARYQDEEPLTGDYCNYDTLSVIPGRLLSNLHRVMGSAFCFVLKSLEISSFFLPASPKSSKLH